MESRSSGRPRRPDSSAEQAEGLTPEVRRGLQRRERASMAVFYDAWFDRVYGFVRRMVGREQLAEDLTQDIFIHLQQNFASYDPERPLKPWVFAIATNKVRDFWRSRRHQLASRESTLDADERKDLAVSDLPEPSEPLERRELGNQIQAAVDALPPSLRVTLELRYFQGLSFEAIGEVIDRNPVAVRKRYSRALEELRAALGPVLGRETGEAR